MILVIMNKGRKDVAEYRGKSGDVVACSQSVYIGSPVMYVYCWQKTSNGCSRTAEDLNVS